MNPRIVPILLVSLLLILQGQLWFGRGSVRNVAKLEAALETQRRENAAATVANAQLDAEIHDLKEGLEIVEEKARSELGMVKNNEIYVQIAK